MLNAIMALDSSLKTWNLAPPQSIHKTLDRSFPKMKTLCVHLGNEGITSVNVVDFSNLHEWSTDNQNRLLAPYKEDDANKFSAAVVRRFSNFLTLAEQLSDDPRLAALFHLVKIMRGLDPVVIAADLLKNEVVTAESCYVAFEVEHPIDFPNAAGVWSVDCYEAISEQLLAKDEVVNAVGKDAFGNPAVDCNVKGCMARFVRYYSCNGATSVYARFGLNSTEKFPLGTKSRRKIQNLLSYLLRPEHKTKYFRTEDGKYNLMPGLHFWSGNRLTLTSIMPKSSLFEADGYDLQGMSMIDFEGEMQQTIAALHAQCTNSNIYGQIMVILKTKGINGSWVLEYSRSATGMEIAKQLERWQDGINNGHRKYSAPLNIRTATNALNTFMKVEGGNVVNVKKMSFFTVSDLYAFFFDDSRIIQRITAHLATKVIPLMIQSQRAEKNPFELRQLFPLCNLTLHKLGILKETYMKTWAFTLGRMMHHANAMHRYYFTSRGFKVPDILIGDRMMKVIYVNPQMGAGLFTRDFQTYLTYMQKRGKGFGLFRHNQYLAQLTEIITVMGQLPIRPNYIEMLELGLGFAYWEAKADKDKIKIEDHKVDEIKVEVDDENDVEVDEEIEVEDEV